MDEPPQFVKVKEEPVELEAEVPPQPIRFIQELFDVLQMDNMRDVISWNQNDDCRFTVHHRARFSEVIPTHFTGVGSLKRFIQLLRNYGFKKYGLEFWHKDRMLCKDKPMLLRNHLPIGHRSVLHQKKRLLPHHILPEKLGHHLMCGRDALSFDFHFLCIYEFYTLGFAFWTALSLVLC